MKKVFCFSIAIVIVSVLMICANSCRKATPPKAIVMVVDDNSGSPVEGARVVLRTFESNDTRQPVIYFLDREKTLADTQYSDKSGKVYYDFKYKAIYKLEVTKSKSNQQPQERRGKGVLSLEEDKTVETTIRINEQTVF